MQTFNLDAPYLGLQNIGATCYMNSVLQTLFMTPEFRRGLYNWHYDKKKHGDQKDSIPLQLQRLFARLQTKIFEYIDPRDLTKSFQWDVHQAFEQHDIQEFIRTLFDAVEQSDPNCQFIQELYKGISVNYVRCLTCNYESQKQDTFLDYRVILKDKFSKIYNDSLQLSIQRSLKPEKLEGSNKYFCEACQSKQDAERGQCLFELPKIFTIHISRFDFDYMLMRRVKLDDRMCFPFVLNMNDYMKGYQEIPNKLSEQCDPKIFEDSMPKPSGKAPSKVTPMQFPPPPPPPKDSKKPAKASVAKASSDTKNFINEMRKKKSQQPQDMGVEIFAKEPAIDIQTQEAIQRSIEEANKQEKPQDDIQDKPELPVEQKAEIVKEEDVTQQQKAPECAPHDGKPGKEQFEPGKEQAKEAEKQTEIKIIDTQKERQKYKEYLDQKCLEGNLISNQQIHEYLKQGEHVYSLYSILIHTGGALGGHYFAFIKSFEDGNWYSFNDSNVTRLDPDDIQKKAFGGQTNSNAYVLFYRKVDTADCSQWGGKFLEEELPAYLQECLKEEKAKLVEYLQSGCSPEDMALLSRPINIKVYYKLEVKVFQLDSTVLFKHLQEQAIEHYQLKDIQNCRLRLYNPHTDQLQDTFEGKENRALGALRLNNKSLAFEFRQPGEEWTTFDQDQVVYRVALWREGLESLEPKFLNLQKVILKQNDTFQDLYDLLKSKFSITKDIMIVRRISERGEIMAMDKALDQFAENSVFYIEEKAQVSRWMKEFELDEHRITIKFNDPKASKTQAQDGQPNDEYPLVCSIDDRANMLELKQKMCQAIGLDPQQVVMRRGGRAGLELKDLDVEVGLNHFVRGSSIHLELGTPVRQGEYRCLLSLATSPNPFEDRNLYSFADLGELAVPGDQPVSHFIDRVAKWASERLGQDLDPKKIRLRERIADRLNKVYRDRPLKEQGIIEMRMISIEILQEELALGQKDVLIHARYWDQQKWDLSARYEFIVQKNASGLDLAKQLSKVFQINPQDIEVCRIVAIHRFSRSDLISEEWYSLDSEDIMLGSQPLHITNDGQMIILRDRKQEQRELTAEEIKQFGIIQSAQSSAMRKGVTTVGGRHKFAIEEKAMKIVVKNKAVEEFEVEQPQELKQSEQ